MGRGPGPAGRGDLLRRPRSRRLEASRQILARLARRFRLGIVSNFYGNLAQICEEIGIAQHVGVIIDSAVVGFEKPDPRIFQAALSALDVKPEAAVFVGDSLPRDMEGARSLGIPHILVGTNGATACCPGDRVVGSVAELLEVLSMTAITAGGVIAAGKGSRLKGLGVPKPMVEVAGVPLIDHVLDNLQAAGVVSAAVIFNSAEEGCAAYVKERFGTLVSKVIVKNTRSSLQSLREILGAAPKGRLLVSTVDAFCPREDFLRFAKAAAKTSSDATVLAVTGFVEDEKPLWVTTTRKGRVTVVGGDSGDAVTAGIYVIPERVRRMRIPDELPRLRDFLAWLCKSGEPIQAIAIGKVVDVDRAEDLESAEELARATAGDSR